MCTHVYSISLNVIVSRRVVCMSKYSKVMKYSIYDLFYYLIFYYITTYQFVISIHFQIYVIPIIEQLKYHYNLKSRPDILKLIGVNLICIIDWSLLN